MLKAWLRFFLLLIIKYERQEKLEGGTAKQNGTRIGDLGNPQFVWTAKMPCLPFPGQCSVAVLWSQRVALSILVFEKSAEHTDTLDSHILVSCPKIPVTLTLLAPVSLHSTSSIP